MLLHLSHDEVAGPDARISDETRSTVNGDAVSAVMIDLMSRMEISNGSINDENAARSTVPSQFPSMTNQCISCLDQIHASMFAGSCGHEFCFECVRQMFLEAIKDKELYPPRCCGEIPPPGIAIRVLHYRELSAFCERAIEWTAEDRLYCADPKCSKFIPPFAIKDEIGIWPSGSQRTHLTCRSFTHLGIDCPMDDALNGVLRMAEDENSKRCFHCRAMAELQHGCNHITCRSVHKIGIYL